MRTTLKSLVVVCTLSAASAFAIGPPDGFVTSQTKFMLWTTAGIKSGDVRVDTNDGIVSLHGHVQTAEQRQLAERTARAVVGVREVRNNLQVVPAINVVHSDREIMAAAEKQLKAEPTLKDSKITVKSVEQGAVVLTGDARTFSDRVRAVAIVNRIAGVQQVKSEVKGPDSFGTEERLSIMLTGKPEPRSSASDTRVTASVKLRLLTTANIPSQEISVDTDDGVVTLFGIVPTVEVRKAAVAEAGKVSGVVRVDNELEVVSTNLKQLVDSKDADINRDLELAFKNRPDLKDVGSSSKNGTVRLTGSVVSSWDELSAVRIARRVAGVHAVENQLKVTE